MIPYNDIDKIKTRLRECGLSTDDEMVEIMRQEILKIPSCEKRSHKAPHHYQSRIVDFMMHHRGIIVYHKVGSGKTMTAIIVSQCYLDKFPHHKVIVITPAGLLDNFRKEMKTSYKSILHLEKYSFYSYEKFCSKKPNCRNALVIIDEGHNLRRLYHRSSAKKATGVMNGIITKHVEEADKVLILTGTPLYNSKNDVIALYNMIRNPNDEPYMKKNFEYDKLRCRISFFDSKHSTEFPKRVDHRIVVEMSDSFHMKYLRLLDDVQKDGESRNALTRILYGDRDLAVFHNAIRRGVNNLETENSNKIQWVIHKIEEGPYPIIVFSHFLDAGNRIIASLLKKKKISFAFIDGSVTMNDRTKIVRDYNKGKMKVLLISKAGGEGLDLKNTRSVIILEPSWNESTLEQVIGRAVRFRSHSDLPVEERRVDVYHLSHNTPTDKNYIADLKKWMRNKEVSFSDVEARPKCFNINTISIDFYLMCYIHKKQQELDKYNKRLVELSIERNYCS